MEAPRSELRRNPLTGRWVVLAPGRADRPRETGRSASPVTADRDRSADPCPFCPGNEHMTPSALTTQPAEGPWVIRVVPNRFPAFEGDDPVPDALLGRDVDGDLRVSVPASGAHEVVVVGPEHEPGLDRLDDVRLGHLGAALIDRLEAHGRRPEIAYTQVILNFGREAGASLDHPHAQLLATPVVPWVLTEEIEGMRRFAAAPTHDGTADCLLCATVEVEEADGQRVVMADESCVAISPHWSGAPYELLLVPRTHVARLQRTEPSALVGVGRVLRDCLLRIRALLGTVAYNVVIHTAPHRSDDLYHWHIHLLPRTSTIAGFEQGTGMLINTTAPEVAARELAAPAGRPGRRG